MLFFDAKEASVLIERERRTRSVQIDIRGWFFAGYYLLLLSTQR